MTNETIHEEITQLNDDIVKIRKILRVGPGEFDLIGINRIKKNPCSCSKATIVMAPGANSDFDTSFEKLAILLAKKNIDVWGIDFRYSFVPDNSNSNPYCTAEDCSFMKDWGTDIYISDLDIVVKIAQMSSREGNIFLSGWSQGGYLAYKYATDDVNNANLNGIIPIDMIYNIDPTLTDVAQNISQEIDNINNKRNSGIFYDDVLSTKYLAFQAYTNPDGPSDAIPGLTNRQAALSALTESYKFGVTPIPNFIYNQGDLLGLKYSDFDFVIQKALKLNSFQSSLISLEIYEQWLDSTIPNVTVPILYIGAEHGFGTYALYTPDMIKNFNQEVTTHIITDYGHADLMYSNNEQEICKKIHDWIVTII